MADSTHNTDALHRVLEATRRGARRLIVAVVGGTVVLIGVIMIFTPGPAVVVIPAGIAILATEFVWARRLLERVRRQVKSMAGNLVHGAGASASPGKNGDPAGPGPWYVRLYRRFVADAPQTGGDKAAAFHHGDENSSAGKGGGPV